MSADPATLFLLHRVMKGDLFTLYTLQPSTTSPSTPPTLQSTPVFVFYDAHHGRLGSLYWTTQKKASARAHRAGYDADDAALPDAYERTQSPEHCLPIHALTFVQLGRTAQLSEALVTSLPSACFLALHSSKSTPPLLLSHPQPAVMRQWVACLRDIFVQHDVDVRDVEGTEKAVEGGNDASQADVSGLKSSGGLMSAFIDPSEGVEVMSLSGANAGLMTLSEGGQLGERKRSSLSVSDNGRAEECGLVSKKEGRRESSSAQSMATCGTCVIS